MKCRSASITLLFLLGLFITETNAGEMDGEWKASAIVRGGKNRDVGDIVITIKENKYECKLKKYTLSGTLKIDATKTPAQYDLTMEGESPDAGATYEGIFVVAGDVMIVTVDVTGKKGSRPKSFGSEPSSSHQLIVWQRVVPTKRAE